MVELGRIAMTNEELTSCGIGALGARHGNNSAHMRVVVELGFDFVTWIAPCPQVSSAFRFLVIRIAALNHKTLDDAMKTSAVIKTGLGKLLEILDGLGRGIRPKLDNHFACAGFNHGHLFVIGSGGGRHLDRHTRDGRTVYEEMDAVTRGGIDGHTVPICG